MIIRKQYLTYAFPNEDLVLGLAERDHTAVLLDVLAATGAFVDDADTGLAGEHDLAAGRTVSLGHTTRLRVRARHVR